MSGTVFALAVKRDLDHAWSIPAGLMALAATAQPSLSAYFRDLDPGTPAWQDEALCAQADPELWFPEKGGSVREAKKVCRRCPVRAECLEYALEHDERFGLWGGLSERERRNLKRRLADAA